MLQIRITNPDLLLIREMTRDVLQNFKHVYGDTFQAEHKIGRMKEVLETCIAHSANVISTGIDIPYHDLRHTFDVVMAMQEILYGKTTLETVKPIDWYNCILAAVNHDIGYVPGLFADDKLSDELTGAKLTSKHVERSMRYIRERYVKSDIVDGKTISELIGYTVFPVPKNQANQNDSYGGLLRAADYIGQFANINIRKKNNALLYEFKDIGLAETFNYKNVGDVIKSFPEFFTKAIEPLLHPAIEYLQRTTSGMAMANSMYGVVKQCELYAGNS
ncbi:MAG: hypothetical protein GY757_54135 [bacterium]|nr:hypothetical protein [bacterium]